MTGKTDDYDPYNGFPELDEYEIRLAIAAHEGRARKKWRFWCEEDGKRVAPRWVRHVTLTAAVAATIVMWMPLVGAAVTAVVAGAFVGWMTGFVGCNCDCPPREFAREFLTCGLPVLAVGVAIFFGLNYVSVAPVTADSVRCGVFGLAAMAWGFLLCFAVLLRINYHEM